MLRVRLLLVALLALGAGIGIGSRLEAHGGGAEAAAQVVDPLDGIAQRGLELGDPNAPVTLVEYADLQCPYCAYWSRATFPVLVRDYVRPGKVRLVFRGLAFLGPDSQVALRAVLAAASQNRLWNLVERLYVVQGPENSGWVDEQRLRAAGASVPGLDAGRLLAEGTSPHVAALMLDAARHADAARVRGTPAFELGRTRGPLRPFKATSLRPDSFRPALDALLAS